MQLKTKKLKAKELPPCNIEPPIITWTHSQICTHLAKLTVKPTSLYVAECCVRYHSPESSWFLGIVNIFHTGTCRGKERQLSEWYLPESCQRVLEKQNALFKSTVYLLFFFFFLHPLCLYVYRVPLECSHLEKQYLSFLVEEVYGFVFFFLKCNQNTRIILMTFLVSGAGFFESVLSQCIPTLIFSDFSPLCYIGITFLKLIGRL